MLHNADVSIFATKRSICHSPLDDIVGNGINIIVWKYPVGYQSDWLICERIGYSLIVNDPIVIEVLYFQVIVIEVLYFQVNVWYKLIC